MSDESERPTVPVVCPDCETTTRVAVSEVAAAVAKHNESLHDGEDVAHVDPDVVDSIADLAAADLGLTDE
ncbi:hypothetical protein [Salinigranum halophilum]|jgi:hypothetical protein|uniref:hypothetical protein n=1 Tax=Salinigranum halophilum TaxID=2565931 RepID=UPI0010A7B465|nr:hypothetical protein [Salinigranum halophilum]